MSVKEYGVLFALGAIWGASFMFIKVAGREMQPFFLVEVRLGLASIALLLMSISQRGLFGQMRAHWRPIVFMGLFNCALPYTLITWGESYINSGLAAIYNACAPLWVGALGLVWIWAEKMSAGRLVGLLAGMLGVALVVSGDLSGGDGGILQLVGQGAVLLAALAYAISGVYGRKRLQGVPLRVAATGQLLAGALMILPLAALQIPNRFPSLEATGSIVTLAILGTSLATLMYYWLLSHVGATRTMLVTYLLPGFALVWGALFLQEPVRLPAVAGLLLILVGITITSGRGAELVGRLLGRAEKLEIRN